MFSRRGFLTGSAACLSVLPWLRPTRSYAATGDQTGGKGPRKFIDVDGIRTSYFEGGAGEDMVLVHGGHSWGRFGTANPHHALGRAIALFDENAVTITSEGEKSSYNVGRIGGGTSINSIPFESWAEVDIRSGDQSKINEIDIMLQAAVEQALQEENAARIEGPELTVDVERVGTRPAAKGRPEVPVLQRALAVIESFGMEPRLRVSSTDANLPMSKGIPAITMSRGGIGGNAHSPSEWWQNKDGHIGIQIGLLTLLAEAGLVE